MKLLIFFVLLVFSFNVSAQNFNGTWAGIFRVDERVGSRPMYPDVYKFSVQLHQAGRAVWGVVSTIDTTVKAGYACLCTVRGQLDKSGSTVSLFPQATIKSNSSSTTGCYSFKFLQATYSLKNQQKLITGKWYREPPLYPNQGVVNRDGSAGTFTLQQQSDGTSIDFDTYFDGLEKWVTKLNPGDASVLEQTVARKTEILPVEQRENVIVKEMTLRNPNVSLQLYAGDDENDTVSVFVNKKLVLSHHILQNTPKKLQLQLDTDSEVLVVSDNSNVRHPAHAVLVIETDGGISQVSMTCSVQQNAELLLRSKAHKKG